MKTKCNDFEVNFEVGQSFHGGCSCENIDNHDGYHVIGCETHFLFKSMFVGHGKFVFSCTCKGLDYNNFR